MLRMMLASAVISMPLLATEVIAQDMPRWDPIVEQALIEKLQTRLPQMRPAYGLRNTAVLSQRLTPRSHLEELATMDTPQQNLRKYTGRIDWM